MCYFNHLITSDLFQPRLVQKRPEALWAFSASVNIFPSLMSNPLAFDLLLPLMYLPNDFLLLAMLLLAKFYLLYWLLCVCSHPLLPDDASVLTLWKPDLLSLCFLFFLSSQFSWIGCFLPFLDFLCNGITWNRSSSNSQLPTTNSLFPQSQKGLSMAWSCHGERERRRGVWEWSSQVEVLRKEEFDWRKWRVENLEEIGGKIRSLREGGRCTVNKRICINRIQPHSTMKRP